MQGGPDYRLLERKGQGTDRGVTGTVASTTTPEGVPPQKLAPVVFGITENATAKVPLMGAPSSALALLGARTKLIEASNDRPKEIKTRFLPETKFRNIVMSSMNEFRGKRKRC